MTNERIPAQHQFIAIAVIALVTIGVYYGSLSGDFVYDDNRQIAQNPLIQARSLYGTAVVSDVWAFKSSGEITASNYWRPTFTLWSIANNELFGIEPFGWRASNLAVHIAAAIAALYLLLLLGIPLMPAAVFATVFAVHPAQVESVAWISGAPSTLAGLFLTLSLIFAIRLARESRGRYYLAGAVGTFLFAVGARESVVVCLPLFWLIYATNGLTEFSELKTRTKAAFYRIGLFTAAAVAFLVVRSLILGGVALPVENAPSLAEAILTAPAIFLFYLKQIFYPVVIGPNYGLRAVSEIGLMSVAFPALLSAAILAFAVRFARSSPRALFGLGLFILPLLPAFYIPAFRPEELVHDRYLFVSILGLCVFFASIIYDRFATALTGINFKAAFTIACFVAFILAFRSLIYTDVWRADEALWRHAVTVDANSATNWRQLGAALEANGKDALSEFERAVAIRPEPLALNGRARARIARNDPQNAIADAERVIATPNANINAYTLFQGYEALSMALQNANRLPEARQRLTEARERLPIYRAALTEKIAVVLYQQGQKAEALRELESVREVAAAEMIPGSKLVFLRLGMLYAELGRRDEARRDVQRFLQATGKDRSPITRGYRAEAEKLLRSLN